MTHLRPPFLLYIKSGSNKLPAVLGRRECEPSGLVRRAGDVCGSGGDVDDEVPWTEAGEGFGFVERSAGDHCVREYAR